jgi:hypothetical protein
MYPKRNDSFFYTCKESFFLGVHPLNPEARLSSSYKMLAEIALAWFAENKYNWFLHYLSEDKYQCKVWAAHLILEFGKPDSSMIKECNAILQEAHASMDTVQKGFA